MFLVIFGCSTLLNTILENVLVPILFISYHNIAFGFYFTVSTMNIYINFSHIALPYM